jgi:hypothetical protein
MKVYTITMDVVADEDPRSLFFAERFNTHEVGILAMRCEKIAEEA